MGDFFDRSEDLSLHSVVLVDVLCDVVEGDGQELSSREVLPFADKVDANVVKGGRGVGIVDLRHGSASVFVDWFPWRAPVGGSRDASFCCCCQTLLEGGVGGYGRDGGACDRYAALRARESEWADGDLGGGREFRVGGWTWVGDQQIRHRDVRLIGPWGVGGEGG